MMTTSSATKFAAVIPSVKPGDFGPVSFAVWSADYKESREVRDGEVVEAIGEVEVEVEREYTDEGVETIELAFRKVRLADGFVGRVSWTPFNGRIGFRPL